MAKSKPLAVSKGTLERMPRPPLFGDIDSMIDELLHVPAMPSIDVIDRGAEVVVRAGVPGYRKQDIEISVAGGSLTIKGERRTEEKEEKGNYFRCEISQGAFSRTVALPTAVNQTRAKLSLKDGMLELRLPKRAKAKRRRSRLS